MQLQPQAITIQTMHNLFKLDIPFLIKENIKTNNFCNYAETKTGFCQSLTKEN